MYLLSELHRCCVLQIPVQCEVVQYQCGDQTSGTVSKGRRAALSDSDRHQEGSDGLSDAAAQDHCNGAVARPVYSYKHTYIYIQSNKNEGKIVMITIKYRRAQQKTNAKADARWLVELT